MSSISYRYRYNSFVNSRQQLRTADSAASSALERLEEFRNARGVLMVAVDANLMSRTCKQVYSDKIVRQLHHGGVQPALSATSHTYVTIQSVPANRYTVQFISHKTGTYHYHHHAHLTVNYAELEFLDKLFGTHHSQKRIKRAA